MMWISLKTPARRSQRQSPAAERGMAVIAALVVVAAASVAAAAILDRQALLIDTLTVERDRAEAQSVLRGGIEWARVILHSDARGSAITHSSAMWAQPIVGLDIQSPDKARAGQFSGVIEDEQGKVNLWRLAAQGTVQRQDLVVLQRVLRALDLPDSLARSIAQRVADAQGAAGRPASAPGLAGMSDLLGMEGITPDVLRALSPHVTIVPARTGINVNTASAVVLSAVVPGLSLAQARDLVRERDRGQWFTDSEDFLNRLPVENAVPAQPVHVRSEWFLVSGEVISRGVAQSMQALLRREGNAAPVIVWVRG
ncbi:type II secretion system minor pseudopilin GspK [Bordetella sp. 15P40C-2]|uniref:type II secretion system minor pseudopilin GspK n=1 Tax=Bordetella sp. 15P40C-2 TaxID=2572246 RepID=UPI00132967B6|nr:type II secretion system minor pseudopilin GspK [Bordetella sp. 15P40C-2]MVW72506.1 type II secretion system minor pseudopilin GspK [Bordetella sp. 15P40C-2]